jgi:hypothetical protein
MVAITTTTTPGHGVVELDTDRQSLVGSLRCIIIDHHLQCIMVGFMVDSEVVHHMVVSMGDIMVVVITAGDSRRLNEQRLVLD